MGEAIKEFHKDGFIVINTPIGEITIALPDSKDVCEGFKLTTDEEDGTANKIIMKFNQ